MVVEPAAVLVELITLLVTESKSIGSMISRIYRLPRDIEDTKSRLEDLHVKMKAADGVKHRSPIIASWTESVNREVPDIEDIFDEYMYIIGEDSLKKKITGEGGGFNSKRRLAEKLKQMKDKIEGICRVPQEVIRCLHSEGGASLAWAPMGRSDGSSHRRADEFGGEDAGELEGLEGHVHSLERWMTVEPAFMPYNTVTATSMAISIYGMPGVGKTTLASRVYNEKTITKHFDCRAWVCVSETCHALELLRCLARKLLKQRGDTDDLGSLDKADLIRTIRQLLRGKRYLIVFDDVWDINFWDEICGTFSSYVKGCRILLTTRSRDVARRLAQDGRVLELKPLEESKALTLFCKKAFCRDPGHLCPSNLRDWPLRIVRKCSGLPLALVVVGSVMLNRDSDPLTWEYSYRAIEEEFSRPHGCIKNAVMLSFHYMPYHLKKCFLYCSMFPEDYPIGRKLLIRLLVAEGFVESRQGVTLEYTAEAYLGDLIHRNMLKVVEWNEAERMRAFVLHDVVREVAAKISKEQILSSTFRNEEQRGEYCSLPRRLSIQQQQHFHRIPHGKPSRLRSLLVFARGDLSTANSLANCLSSLRLLRVLDLRGAPIRVVPDVVFRLYNLNYLSLRDTKVEYAEFPKEIAKLQHLQTLDLVRTHVHGLPRKITKLQELRHLMISDACDTPAICDLPKHMNRLNNLQTLKSIRTSDYDSLRELTELRSLSINEVHNSLALCNAICCMGSLLRLKVKSARGHCLALLDLSPNLRKLLLHGQLRSFPSCLGSLHNLTHLYLFESKVNPPKYQTRLSYVESLPRLVFLCLDNAYDGAVLTFPTGHFQSLRELCILEMPFLQDLEILEGALPAIQKLHVKNCRMLNRVPAVEWLPCLQDLLVKGISEGIKLGLKEICTYLPNVNLRSF